MSPISIRIPALVMALLATAALLGGSLLAAATVSADSASLQTGSRAPFIHLINLYDRDGKIIDLRTSTIPYSPAMTCGKCHNLDAISHGWHFNASDPASAANSGRPGEPWILTDAATGTQLPLSDRPWPGDFSFKSVGITSWQFTKIFGARTPGGGLSDSLSEIHPDPNARWKISGKLEIDCLICHSADRSYNPVERAHQIELENFQYAPTVGAGLGEVRGSSAKLPDTFDPDVDLGDNPDAPALTYNKSRADSQNRVRFNVTRQPPAETCYACHSTQSVGPGTIPRFQHDKDVHMARGFTCTDCHRDAIDHMISRGYPGEARFNKTPLVSTLSCQGCHLGDQSAADIALARGGRMGAPHPLHRGLPPIHFEKLSCTACHSGEYPESTTHLVQTSMAHQLGMPSEHRDAQTLPHLVEPLFLKDSDGKIAPYRGFWPAYWGKQNPKDQSITPLPLPVVQAALADVLPKPANPEAYVPLDYSQIELGLRKLPTDFPNWWPVYVAGGKVYRPSERRVAIFDNPAANLIAWPIAHDVRPAAQAIGAKSCTECHAADSPLYNAMTANSAWPQAKWPVPMVSSQAMYELRGENPLAIYSWSMAFSTRSTFKIMALVCMAIVAAVLFTHAWRGFWHLLTLIARRDKT